jgi:hypothetical protein
MSNDDRRFVTGHGFRKANDPYGKRKPAMIDGTKKEASDENKA